MPRQLLPRTACTTAALVVALGLGACASQRFDGGGPRAPRASADPLAPAPTGRVTSEPLAPLPGTLAEAAPPPGASPVPPVVAEVAPPPPAPPPVVATGRSAVVGGWTATDASGSCRVSLSSAPALDLYKATTSGCSNKDLARVSAWDFRDGEVYLYQPGGTVAARLRQAGGSLDGALSKSGAALTLAR